MNFRAPAMVFGIGPGFLLCCCFHIKVHLRYKLSGLVNRGGEDVVTPSSAEEPAEEVASWPSVR